MSNRGDVMVRRASTADDAQVLGLMRAALGWRDGDPNEALFAWKHADNPFGRSPAWVAEINGEIVGFRTFMRWGFRGHDGSVDAVRAVDTATHPKFQGRGIFRTLTLHALDEMAAEGISFVFNTPNDRSRPGYLKMGWKVVGHLPVAALIPSLGGAVKMLSARTAADLWSLDTAVGENPLDVFTDQDALKEDATESAGNGISTDRSIGFMRWRYGLPALRYRVVVAAGGISSGFVVFRLRRRGGAVEAAIGDVSAPSPKARHALVRRVLRLTRADYAISLGSCRTGLPLYRQGPILTYRAVSSTKAPLPLDAWALTLGDIELF